MAEIFQRRTITGEYNRKINFTKYAVSVCIACAQMLALCIYEIVCIYTFTTIISCLINLNLHMDLDTHSVKRKQN